MSDIVVDHPVIDDQLDDENKLQSALCSLDDNAWKEAMENEEEEQTLDIPQLCLKAELATVLADQVEVLRERNLASGPSSKYRGHVYCP